jgi:multidrug efflux pump subunit AcrA (membrane-fusion protein)
LGSKIIVGKLNLIKEIKKMKREHFLLFEKVICVFLLVVSAMAQTGGDIAAITVPSADINLSFVQAGRVDKIFVKEGDKVDVNGLVLEQYCAAEEAMLAQKKLDLKRYEWAKDRGAATDLEFEHAKLEVKIAEIRVDNMRLKSPINGSIENIEVETGESVKALEGVIRIVKTDPLWIDVPVPLERAYMIKVSDSAGVIFPGIEKASVSGKVVVVSTAADAASSTLRVRIEVPNTMSRPSGEHVLVNFNTGKLNSNKSDSNESDTGKLDSNESDNGKSE